MKVTSKSSVRERDFTSFLPSCSDRDKKEFFSFLFTQFKLWRKEKNRIAYSVRKKHKVEKPVTGGSTTTNNYLEDPSQWMPNIQDGIGTEKECSMEINNTPIVSEISSIDAGHAKKNFKKDLADVLGKSKCLQL